MEIKRYSSKHYGVSAYDMADVIKWNMIQQLFKKWHMVSPIEYVLSTPIGWFKAVEKDSYYDLYYKEILIQGRVDNLNEITEVLFDYLDKRRLETVEMRNFFIELDK